MERVAAAFEPHRFVGDRHFDPELLRLAERAAHQRHAGNPGREAEIILDSGRGAGLAAEGAAIEGRAPTAPPTPHRPRSRARPARRRHDHVVEASGSIGADQTDAAGELAFGRIAQQLPPGQSTIGSSSGSTSKRSTRVCAQLSCLGIELLMGMAVAAEEIDQPQHVGIARRGRRSPARRRRSRAGRRAGGSAHA